MGNLPAVTWDSGKYNFQRKLGNFVQYFQVNLPNNGNGIPLKLVNPVLIADKMFDCETTDDFPDQALEDALMRVDYDEGIPTIEGLPIWERIDGELLDYYKLFKEYREMMHITGSRAIAKLAANHNLEGKLLSVLSKVYHWQSRCKAYDLFKKMELAKRHALEVERMNAKHTGASNLLLEAGLKYLEDHPEQLNPKVALQMVEVAIKAGRLSVGLSDRAAAGNSSAANINISNTTHTGTQGDLVITDTTTQVSSKEDIDHMQSIVHILDQSGALDRAKSKVIDADFAEVTTEAVEGT